MFSVIDRLNQFSDPRDSKKVRHPLATILVTTHPYKKILRKI